MLFRAIISQLLHVCLVLCTAQSPFNDRASSNPLDEEFDALVNSTLTKWRVPGIAVAVVDGERTFAKGYGIANLLMNESVTPSTMFYTGSTTKAFTAAAMSMLVDNSSTKFAQVEWTTPIAKLIHDDFVLQDSYATQHITIEDALSHRSGMPGHELSYGDNNTSVRETVRSLRHLPLTKELRTTYQYSNLMFIVVAHVIETLTGSWLGDFLEERIWRPLAMHSTFFCLDDALQVDQDQSSEVKLAHGYRWDNDSLAFVDVPWSNVPLISGAGNMISNVLDYSKWIRCMIDRSGPMSPSGHRALVSAHSIAIPEGVPPSPFGLSFTGPILYGFGWILTVYRGEPVVMHAGGINGFGSYVIYLPDRRWGFVALSNSLGTSTLMELQLAFQLIEDLLETPKKDRLDWENVDKELEKLPDPLAGARERLYPSVPSPPLPPTLPIKSYTGTYHHPAYRNITFRMDSHNNTNSGPTGTYLHAYVTAIANPYDLWLSHITGDHFLANITIPALYPEPIEAVRAEFIVDTAGEATKVGIELEPAMGDDKIWFERI